MSNFNPNAKQLKPDEWRTLAAKNVIREADSASRDFVLSALLGLIAAGLTGMMPVGVGIVGCGIIRGWRKNNLMDRRIKAIQQGCAAPFLDQMQLRRFTNQTSLNEALLQIYWAIGEDIEIFPSAEDLYELHGASLALPEADEAIEVTAVAAADGAVMGSDTKLGAVEAAPVQPQGAAPAVHTKSLLIAIKEDPKSSFFAAPARVGKGITIAAAIRLVQQRVTERTLTKVTFWAITPKQDPQEHWYWETCDQFFNPNIETGDRALAARGIYNFIKAFTALPRTPQSPTILIVDELQRLTGLLKRVKMDTVDPELFAGDSQNFGEWLLDKLILSASMSQSIGYYVWVATPAATVAKQGFSKSDVDSLNIYTLATKDNLKFANGGTAAFSAPKTASNHPVFARGYAAGYSHQHQRWYHVEDLSKQVASISTKPPVRLKNYWVPALQDSTEMQSSVAVAIVQEEEPEDLILELIGEVPDRDKREALMIAYQWASKRLSEGKEVDRDAFLERARKDRNCVYLRDNREIIWDELSGLIS
jgi:hypothetical protein